MTERIKLFIRQLFCRHDRILTFEDHRMFLKCQNCTHETPGWEIE